MSNNILRLIQKRYIIILCIFLVLTWIVGICNFYFSTKIENFDFNKEKSISLYPDSVLSIQNYDQIDNQFYTLHYDPQIYILPPKQKIASTLIEFVEPINTDSIVQIYYAKKENNLVESNSVIAFLPKGSSEIIINLPPSVFTLLRYDINIIGESFEIKGIYVSEAVDGKTIIRQRNHYIFPIIFIIDVFIILLWLIGIKINYLDEIKKQIKFIKQFIFLVTKRVSIKSLYLKAFCFIFAFLLVYLTISHQSDMLGGSGDTHSIWGTITSFYSENMQSSYVLYKGIHSVYPYVWFYRLSNILGIDDFFFIKVYFALLFAYAAALGMPYIVSKLLKKEINFLKRIIWILIAFWIWRSYGVFGHLWVDLPNFSYLTMAAAMVLKLNENEIVLKKNLIVCFFAGLLCAFAGGGSGQYSFTAYFLPLFMIINIFRKTKIHLPENRSRILTLVFSVIVIISGVAAVKFSDHYFEKSVVQPLRDKGEFLPAGKEWLISGLSSRLLFMTYGYAIPSLPDNRGEAIIRYTDGDNAENRINIFKMGGNGYAIHQYINLILKHPLDFIARWGNRFFIIMSFDNGESSVIRLFIGFTLLYLTIFSVYKNCKTAKSLFRPGLLIISVFIIPGLVPCLMHIEKRCGLSIQALILGIGLFDDTLENACRGLVNIYKKRDTVRPVLSETMSFPFFIYILFIIICFLHHASLMELAGPVTRILFKL